MKIHAACIAVLVGSFGLVVGCASESASDNMGANQQHELSSSTSTESQPSKESTDTAKILCEWHESRYYDHKDDCLAFKRIDNGINDFPVDPPDEENCWRSENNQSYYLRCI